MDFLEQPFTFPDLTGKHVLIVGVGGGCDIISAYALAQMLRRVPATAPAEIIYANTKREPDESLEAIAPHIYRVPRNVRKLAAGEQVHGTARIDQAVARGSRGCPWILQLPREMAGQQQLVESLHQLAEWHLVISVDTGADSIVTTAESGTAGRDKVMLRLLRKLGVPLLHIVVGPGCDGETSYADVRVAFHRLQKNGQYAGCFPLDPMLASYRKFAVCLDAGRTPNILLSAFDGTLPSGSHGGLMVPRGMEPEIPRSWLTRAFVFRLGGRQRLDTRQNHGRST